MIPNTYIICQSSYCVYLTSECVQESQTMSNLMRISSKVDRQERSQFAIKVMADDDSADIMNRVLKLP